MEDWFSLLPTHFYLFYQLESEEEIKIIYKDIYSVLCGSPPSS